LSDESSPPCFVLSAPSGAGKTTLAQAVLQRVEKLVRTISWTTRPPRLGEIDGTDYVFASQEVFDANEDAGGFLESASVHGFCYGTPTDEVQRILGEGSAPLMVIDVQGAEAVRQRLPDPVTIFVLPPSRRVLERRLGGRDGADPTSDETLRRRLGVAAEEIAQFVRYDYVVINDEFDRAVRELEAILVAELCRQPRRRKFAREILESFR
jgi:guanylate kinase